MIRFLADASLRHAIVSACVRREPTIEFLSAHRAKLEGLADPDVLRIAADQNRILVTQDFRTMPRHFGDFLEAGHTSPGVFLVKQRTPVVEVVEFLLLVWAVSAPEEWRKRILEIPFR
jgi:hypothetical protein